MTGMTATTATTRTTDESPAVRLQPCAAFHFDPNADWPACDDCGWLDDEHPDAVEVGGAVITEVPRRRVQVPERLAS
jgi:hypothetical protein